MRLLNKIREWLAARHARAAEEKERRHQETLNKEKESALAAALQSLEMSQDCDRAAKVTEALEKNQIPPDHLLTWSVANLHLDVLELLTKKGMDLKNPALLISAAQKSSTCDLRAIQLAPPILEFLPKNGGTANAIVGAHSILWFAASTCLASARSFRTGNAYTSGIALLRRHGAELNEAERKYFELLEAEWEGKLNKIESERPTEEALNAAGVRGLQRLNHPALRAYHQMRDECASDLKCLRVICDALGAAKNRT